MTSGTGRSIRRKPAVLHGRRRMAAAGLVVAALLATPGAATGQGGTWGAVFPESAALGPPAWVQPGTRIVYYVASASVAQSRYQYVAEPCDPNASQYQSPTTGQCYRRTDESGEGVGSGSGSGYAIIDVVAADGPGQVVTAESLYVIDTATGALTYLPIGGGPESSGAVDAVWLHPAILEDVLAGRALPGGLEPLAGRYPLGGTTYEVVAIQGNGDSVTFDRASGLVLVNTGAAVGTTLPVHLPGEDPSLGNRMLTYQRLVGTRQRAVAGVGASVPGWLRPGTTLVFQGSYTLGAAVAAQTTITFDQVGASWASLDAVFEVGYGGITSRDEARVVSGGDGPFWYDPSALAAMRAGDVLDTDPMVGLQDRVEEVAYWDGGEYVSIVTEGNGMLVRFLYDRATGVPLGYDLQQGVGVTSVRLTAMPPGAG